ncbi:MAG: putative porin [Chlorobiales bacterium]|nr:putative porin [Chlorobiales bacterium]
MKKFIALFAFLLVSGWSTAEAVEWNWKGDVRYRYESKIKSTKENSRDRHRIRARLGVYPWITEELTAGVQVSTAGGGDPVSRNQTLGDGFTAKDLNLNQAFIDYHPMFFEGETNFIFGKREVKQTLIRVNDLVWDSDLTLEGMTFHFGKDGKQQREGLNAVAGYYFINEDGDIEDDPFFWAAQLAYTGQAGDLGFMLGAGYYDFENIQGGDDGDGTAVLGDWSEDEGFFGNSAPLDVYEYDYNIVEIFGNVGGKFDGSLPWKFYGQYAINVADGVEDMNNGYLIGFKLGKAKKVGQWEIDANYSYLESDAVLGAYTDSDRWGGGTDGQGFEVGAKYHFVQNMTVGAKYLRHEDGIDSGTNLHVLQADMVVKF